MNHLLFRFVATLSLLLGTVAPVQALPPAPATGIRILVSAVHHGGNIIYSYKVINNGDTPFGYFTIGSHFDIAEDYEYPQLTRLPLGWKYGRTGETGTAIILDSASTSQPTDWISHVFGQQEADTYYLNWYASGDMSDVISPGQTLAGFSVTVPVVDSGLDLPIVTGMPPFIGPDEMYTKGDFKVGFVTGKYVWGTLERLDTTPPTLTVSLSPSMLWPPNEKLVPITAPLTVKDDYDPEPEIMLESITVNEPAEEEDVRGVSGGTDDRFFQLRAKREGKNKAGRIYTVTYSATDGSGNRTMASATVIVPHDQDEKKKLETSHGKKHD